MRTAALIGTNGSLDWLCFPYFDSPSVFAAILDDHEGGRFAIEPTVEGFRCKQLYWPDSNVLVTRFQSDSGVAEVTDYMPVGANRPSATDGDVSSAAWRASAAPWRCGCIALLRSTSISISPGRYTASRRPTKGSSFGRPFWISHWGATYLYR